MATRSLTVVAVFALLASACGASSSTAGSATPSTAAPSGSAPSSTTAITERDFHFDTPKLSVATRSVLAVTNAGPTVHNLAIRDAGGKVLATTHDLKPGAAENLNVDVPSGTYAIICTLPGHESLGLKGVLDVTP